MILDINCQFFGKDSIKPLLEGMDRSHTDRTLLSAAIEGTTYADRGVILREVGNEDVANAVEGHTDRLAGCMHINPLFPDSLETIERYAQKGFKAAKLIPAEGYFPDDSRFYPVFDKLQEYGMTVLFYMGQVNFTLSHDGGKRRALNSAYGYPMRLDAVSRLFPDIKLVIIHMGFPFLFEAWSVHHANKNVYLEISGNGAYFDALPVGYAAVGGPAFIPLDFNKVVWGSDNVDDPGTNRIASAHYVKLMGCMDGEIRRNVFGNNAARILGIS